jgi:hypothetical protein
MTMPGDDVGLCVGVWSGNTVQLLGVAIRLQYSCEVRSLATADRGRNHSEGFPL